MSGEQQFSAVHLGVGEVAIGDDRRQLVIVRMPDEATAEAFVRNFNRPDRDPLPEGVHADARGRLWLLPTYPMPADHDFYNTGIEAWDTPYPPSLACPSWSETKAVQIRPIPAPETERVPLHELRGRRLPEFPNEPIARLIQHASGGRWLADFLKQHPPLTPLDVDADGTVEVQK